MYVVCLIITGWLQHPVNKWLRTYHHQKGFKLSFLLTGVGSLWQGHKPLTASPLPKGACLQALQFSREPIALALLALQALPSTNSHP